MRIIVNTVLFSLLILFALGVVAWAMTPMLACYMPSPYVCTVVTATTPLPVYFPLGY